MVAIKPFHAKVIPDEPQNPRDWGLKYESCAKDAYLRVQDPFAPQSQVDQSRICDLIDNIRSCECACECKPVIVEYKCPMSHKDKDPKEAFLTPEIGGCVVGNTLKLERKAKYFYQVQMQMFVLGLKACDFVVWTRKGIKCVEILFDPQFMVDVSKKLERFWIGQVLPLMISGAAKEKKSHQLGHEEKRFSQSGPTDEKPCQSGHASEKKLCNQSEGNYK